MCVGSLFWTLAANRQHACEGALSGTYSRCTDWKFYTWFHLNGTNGPIIAPFHHFPSQGDVNGGWLRGKPGELEHMRQVERGAGSDAGAAQRSEIWELAKLSAAAPASSSMIC